MAIVDFDTTTWTDKWFRKLKPKQKVLFIYLWTNNHKNIAGLYEIDFEIIAFETGISLKEIGPLIDSLIPKVLYDYDEGSVFVVNFIRKQFMRTPKISPKIIQGITKSLIAMDGSSLIGEFLKEYSELNIEYIYPINRVYIYPSGEGGGEGKGVAKKKSDLKYTKNFLLFYDAYPKKQDKEKAFKSFCKIDPDENLLNIMIESVQAFKKTDDWKKEKGTFVPMPSTWLNNKRWKDEVKVDVGPEDSKLGSTIEVIKCRECKRVIGPKEMVIDGECGDCNKDVKDSEIIRDRGKIKSLVAGIGRKF